MKVALDFVEQVPIPTYVFCVVGDEFLLEDINPAGRQRNPALAALRGKPMAALYSDQPQVIEDARRCVVEQVAVERELAVRRYDRTEATQYLRLTFVPVSSEYMLLFMQDVANRIVEQTALDESEARYQSLIASLPDAVVLRGADGRVLFCNDVAVSLFGAESQAALLGETEILAPGLQIQTDAGEVIPESEFPSRRVATTGQAELGRVYAIVGHGGLHWIRVAAQPIRSATGVITGSVTTMADITDRVQVQGALRESATRLDLAMSAAKMGMWEFEPGTDIGWWSPNLDEIFRIGARQRGFAGFLAHIHGEDRAAVIDHATRIARDPSADGFEQEFRIIGEDQVTRWARIRGQMLSTGRNRRIGGVVMDITEQRHLEEELHRASRLESIGRLAGGVAHDFNNLLAAMLGSLELIEEHCPESIQEDLETIRHSALRARDLTRQLLAFARKQPVEWQTVDLAALVRRVDLMLRRLVGSSIVIEMDAPGSVHVRADPALLEQVLVNLVVNARDAMPNGGKLVIRVERGEHAFKPTSGTAPAAVVSVVDSGIGMDEDTRRHIFDPFFTTKKQGTGLGLASSYGIIQQHQGNIDVASRPGEGTAFRVILPALPSPQPDRENVVASTNVEGNAKATILVVDDDDIVRETAARMVRSLGYTVATAAGGADALQHCLNNQGKIDAVLCDIAMPGIDGLTVSAELRNLAPKVRILLMSGYSTDVQDRALAGAHFLQKPFSRAEIANKLAEIFST